MDKLPVKSDPIVSKYDNLDDLHEKIKEKIPPTANDKVILMNRIHRQLNPKEHLHILVEFLHNLDKRIHSMTENATLFDLNDLPPDVFWQIYLYVHLCLQNREQQGRCDRIQSSQATEIQQFEDQMKDNLRKFQSETDSSLPEKLEELPPYEQMRIRALSQCSYSTYANDLSHVDVTEDKRLEKTIYSDHRWSTTASTTSKPSPDPISQPPSTAKLSVTKAKIKVNLPLKVNSPPPIIQTSTIDILDEDDDDDVDEDALEKAELDRFKNQFLKINGQTTGDLDHDEN